MTKVKIIVIFGKEMSYILIFLSILFFATSLWLHIIQKKYLYKISKIGFGRNDLAMAMFNQIEESIREIKIERANSCSFRSIFLSEQIYFLEWKRFMVLHINYAFRLGLLDFNATNHLLIKLETFHYNTGKNNGLTFLDKRSINLFEEETFLKELLGFHYKKHFCPNDIQVLSA